jgi:cell division protein FtsI/penicillin-binding protein 2
VGRAAAVVIDPDTGDLLASASYPWPLSPELATPAEHASDSLLDRARYGLYPPGSTFKLVTASAALRQHLDPDRATSMCVRLPDGRVGASIAGWSRPIRDDVLDTHPHGTIDMHEGFVHSCNAYFAQLAVRLGSQPLLDAASRLGISLTPASDAAGRVRATLPQIGYGQGDVVATPLRMARAAAAVASNGVLRDTRWEGMGSEGSPGVQFLDADAARLLAGYMRDVVLNGTGRTLRGKPEQRSCPASRPTAGSSGSRRSVRPRVGLRSPSWSRTLVMARAAPLRPPERSLPRRRAPGS